MTKKQKKDALKIAVSAAFLLMAAFFSKWFYVQLILYLAAYLCVGFGVLKKSFRNICCGQVFDENFLMMIATFGAFVIGEYAEGVFVMLFYQVGELFESVAVGKSRKSIAELMEICPEYANVERDGEFRLVDPSELVVGDVIVVKPGEKVPVDGVVTEGESSLDTANLTGEAVPRFVKIGDGVISGCINLEGLLRVSVEKEFKNSTVSKILDLVENASSKKSVSESFITKFARFYTPIVVVLAAFMAVAMPMLLGEWQEWLKRALVFLVVSCPCALVISVPLSFFCGIGCASKNGVLIKGSNYIEAFSKCITVVFDKTGTLTKGAFEVAEVDSDEYSKEELLCIAAHGEQYSNHPIAASVCKAYVGEYSANVTDVNEISGKGIKYGVDGNTVLVGNAALLSDEGIEIPNKTYAGTVVYVAVKGRYAGCIVVEDSIKNNVKTALAVLRKCGVEKQIMLSGDSRIVAEAVGKKLGLDDVKSELLPSDKVTMLESILGEKQRSKTVAYVGDGVNDAPVLSRADVGIAMGAMGSDAAIEAADIVLMDDRIEKIPFALCLSKRTMNIVRQNVIFALSIKFLVLILSVFGLSNMWVAVFADVGVAFIAILNAMRMLKFQLKQ